MDLGIRPQWFPARYARQPRKLDAKRLALVDALARYPSDPVVWQELLRRKDSRRGSPAPRSAGPEKIGPLLQRLLPKGDIQWDRGLFKQFLLRSEVGDLNDDMPEADLVTKSAEVGLGLGSDDWFWVSRRVLLDYLVNRVELELYRPVGRRLTSTHFQTIHQSYGSRFRMAAKSLLALAAVDLDQPSRRRALAVGVVAAALFCAAIGEPTLDEREWAVLIRLADVDEPVRRLASSMAHDLRRPRLDEARETLWLALDAIDPPPPGKTSWPPSEEPEPTTITLTLDPSGRIVPALRSGGLGKPLLLDDSRPIRLGQKIGRLIAGAAIWPGSGEKVHRSKRSQIERALRAALKQDSSVSGSVSVTCVEPASVKSTAMRIHGVRLAATKRLRQAIADLEKGEA